MFKILVISIIASVSSLLGPVEIPERHPQAEQEQYSVPGSDDNSFTGDAGSISSTLPGTSLEFLRAPQPGVRVIEEHGSVGALLPQFEKLGRHFSIQAVRKQVQVEPGIRRQLQLIYPHHDFW